MLFDLLRVATLGRNMELLSRLQERHQPVQAPAASRRQPISARSNQRRQQQVSAASSGEQPAECKPLDLSVRRCQQQQQQQQAEPNGHKLRSNRPAPNGLDLATRGAAKSHQQQAQAPATKLISSSTSPSSGSSVSSLDSDDKSLAIGARLANVANDVISSTNGRRQKQKGTRNHLCNQCGRSFSRSDMLTRHSRLHSGLKPYQCGKCLQVFSRSDHLSTHERTHTGEKPYQCEYCAYSACRRDMITRHMRTHTSRHGRSARLKRLRVRQKMVADVGEISLVNDEEDVSTSLEVGNFASQKEE